VGISLFLTIFAYAELAGKYFAFPDYKSPFRDIYGFPEITKKADELLRMGTSKTPKAIAVTNWTMGSRTMYYSLPYANEVFVIDNRKDQFDVWQTKSPYGYDLLFLNTHFHELDIANNYKCEKVELAGKKDIILNSKKVDSIKYVWCRNYQGDKL
jgi:hypothetical protein